MSKDKDLITVNSDKYWDKRFLEDWDEKGGPEQSRFFARLALDMLPKWIIREIWRDKLTVVDWGCAEGDGTDVLAESIDKAQIYGVDISEVAVETAERRYPCLSFKQMDLLDENDCGSCFFDIVFSSNTLEHFHNPADVIEKLSKKTRKALIFLLPYREQSRFDEHFASFTPNNIKSIIGEKFPLIFSKVFDCSNIPESRWLGEQILLIYADESWLSSLSLVLSDLHIENDDNSNKIKSLESHLSAKNYLVSKLEKDLSDEINKSTELEDKLSREIAKIHELENSLSNESLNSENLREQLEVCNSEVVSSKEKVQYLERINSELVFFRDESSRILHSKSWRITAPLRFLRQAYKNRSRYLYSSFKWLYWKLPFFLRQYLQGPKHSIIRYFRGTSSKLDSRPIESTTSSDLTWAQFQEKVIANRNSYKGIFIQELVIDWNVPLYQRPQHISAAMGRLGYLVIYKTDNWAGDNVNGFREVEKNVWITNREEVDKIYGAVRSVYSTAYANTVEYINKIKEKNILIYEYIDHIDQEISGDEKNIKRLLDLKKLAFEGGVDYVVASANQLYDEAVEALGEERVLLAQNGVDTRHYRNPAQDQVSVPVELEKFCERYEHVVGYFGALAPWLWYDVIAELIEKREDLGFVFIGPDYYGGSAKLPKGDNVLCLGPVDYKILPAHAKKFDICFIPFKPGDIAQTTSPLKLFEYFALEKPVVVTSYMRECVQYPEVFRGGNVEELSDAFNEAIALKDDSVFKKRMANLADENDWDQRAKVISRCFGI